jgi:hypothetical protein
MKNRSPWIYAAIQYFDAGDPPPGGAKIQHFGSPGDRLTVDFHMMDTPILIGTIAEPDSKHVRSAGRNIVGLMIFRADGVGPGPDDDHFRLRKTQQCGQCRHKATHYHTSLPWP